MGSTPPNPIFTPFKIVRFIPKGDEGIGRRITSMRNHFFSSTYIVVHFDCSRAKTKSCLASATLRAQRLERCRPTRNGSFQTLYQCRTLISMDSQTTVPTHHTLLPRCGEGACCSTPIFHWFACLFSTRSSTPWTLFLHAPMQISHVYEGRSERTAVTCHASDAS